MKSRLWISILSLACTLAPIAPAAGQPAPAATAQCGDDRHPVTCRAIVVVTPSASLTVAVANSFPLREHGLMFRTSLEPHTGMLFVFRTESDPVEFWMKNTLIPLDRSEEH